MKTILFDIEADGLIAEDLKAITMAVTWCEEDGLLAWAVPKSMCVDVSYGGNQDDFLEYLAGARSIVAHNGIGYDFPAIKTLGFKPDKWHEDYYLDTLVLSRMCYPNLKERDEKINKVPSNMWGRHSLESWGWRTEKYKGSFKGPWDKATPEMLDYCVQDVAVLREIWGYVWLHRANRSSFRQVEHRFAEAIHLQELNGFSFDEEYANELTFKLAHDRAKYTDLLMKSFPPDRIEMKTPQYWVCEIGKMYDTKTEGKADGAKNLTRGPNKVKVIPFKITERAKFARKMCEKYDFEWPVMTDHETKPSPKVDATVLKTLPYPEAEWMRLVLDCEKGISMVAEGKQSWLNQVRDGRIYGKVNTLGARTTRCTHWNPNVAQVPAGPDYRKCFRATPGMTLVGADASGIEARMLAHYMAHYDGGEFAEIVLNGDIHQVNADTWGLDSRSKAKAPFYAMMYGAGNAKMGSLLGGGSKKGKQIKKQFFDRFPAFETLLTGVQKKGKWLTGLDGRLLYSVAENSALNTLLQGAGATVMKYALVDFMTKDLPPSLRLCANVHDEVQMEVNPEDADTVGQAFVQSIRWAGEHLKLKCPLDGEYKTGITWADTH